MTSLDNRAVAAKSYTKHLCSVLVQDELPRYAAFKKCTVSHASISNDNATEIAVAIEHSKKLQSLIITDCPRMTSVGICTLLQACCKIDTSLTNLELQGITLNQYGLQALGELVSNCTELKSLIMEQIQFEVVHNNDNDNDSATTTTTTTSSSTSATSICIDDNEENNDDTKIAKNAWQQFCDCLSCNTTLQTLDLSQNKYFLTPWHIEIMSQKCHVLPPLKCLNVSHNPQLGNAGMKSICDNWLQKQQQQLDKDDSNTSLSTLSSSFGDSTIIAGKCCQLTMLAMSSCNLSNDALNYLVSTLNEYSNCCTLQRVYLYGNHEMNMNCELYQHLQFWLQVNQHGQRQLSRRQNELLPFILAAQQGNNNNYMSSLSSCLMNDNDCITPSLIHVLLQDLPHVWIP